MRALLFVLVEGDTEAVEAAATIAAASLAVAPGVTLMPLDWVPEYGLVGECAPEPYQPVRTVDLHDPTDPIHDQIVRVP